MSDFSEFKARDIRLIILRELDAQDNGALHDRLLVPVVETFGYAVSRDYVRTQLRKLAELEAVTLTEAGSVLVARITRAGVDHVKRRGVIEGIERPDRDG